MATLKGTEGDDSIRGTSSHDVINGRSGSDSIQGMAGNDLIISGSGNDTIDAGTGDDLVVCGTLTSGNAGGLSYVLSTELLKVDLGDGNDFIALHSTLLDGSYLRGGKGLDTINLAQSYGERSALEIKTITGFENWILTGNMGSTIGAASLLGSNIYWGTYTDFVIEPHSVKLYNENVFNLTTKLTIYYEAVNENTLDASAIDNSGIKVLAVTATGATSKIIGSQQADEITGSSSSDNVKGEGGNDLIDGGDGVDTAIYSGNYSNYIISEITYNIFSVKDSISTDGTDTIVDINKLQFADRTIDVVIRGMEIIGDETAEEISGGDEADRLDGAGGNDVLDGGLGNDLIDGGTGNDELVGAQGNDFLNGGDGNDELIGGSGDNELNGGAGIDAANYSTFFSRLSIDLLTGRVKGSSTDVLFAIENIIGGKGNDTITGNAESNEITAGSGNDTVDAGAGDDMIVGGDGAGDDTYKGGTGADTINYASAKSGITVNLSATKDHAKSTLSGDKAVIGIDQLSGIENVIAGKYNDVVQGNAVSNVLTGGLGTDGLFGGSDKVKDVFDFNAVAESKMGTARDKVYDFVSKIDKIDLSGIDANSKLAEDHAFAFNGTTAQANALWYRQVDVDGDKKANDLVVYADINGDAKADFEIGLVGVVKLVQADFVL